MKILNLIIKQVYLEQIIAGTKRQEFREIKPTTEKKYIELDAEGYAIENEYGNSIPIHYDAIRFFVGYNKERDSALIEVVDAHTEIVVDENGQPISYFLEDGEEYFMEQIVYDLGKVLQKNIK